jgi:hypothetical protein
MRPFEHTPDEGLEIITAGLQQEQRDLSRIYDAVMQERTIRYAQRLQKEGYETPYPSPER